jgi:serine/threonine protein phosphatase 1
VRRIFAVGDVHGCDVALETLLERIQLTPQDRLIFLGDAIDRGPDSRRVVELILEVGSSCRMDFVMGNHEQMLLDSLENPAVANSWLGWGGAETLDSYGGDFDDIPEEHLDFFADALPYVETDADICVHANLEPGVPLEEQTGDWLRWQKISGRELPHESGKRIVCGHTPMPGDIPHTLEGWVMIDTGAYKGGFLTALDLTTGEILQARQSGEFRRGVYLDELF